MKATAISVLSAFVLIALSANTPHTRLATYVTINDGTARCNFSFPDNYEQHVETEATMYNANSDDVAFEMHYRSTTNIESLPGRNFQAQANNTSQFDKLQQFTNTLVLATGGQLINQFDVTQNGQQGREIELNFDNEGDTYKMYVRFFWHNNTIYAFTLSTVIYYGSASVSPSNADPGGTLLNAKNQVFGSINFY